MIVLPATLKFKLTISAVWPSCVCTSLPVSTSHNFAVFVHGACRHCSAVWVNAIYILVETSRDITDIPSIYKENTCHYYLVSCVFSSIRD